MVGRGPRSPKHIANNSSFAILSFTPILTVSSGPGWRQDLAILSPEGPRDSTCQLRPHHRNKVFYRLKILSSGIIIIIRIFLPSVT